MTLTLLYKNTGRAIALILASAMGWCTRVHCANVKVLVKVFRTLYLLNMWMDLVDPMPVVTCRYTVYTVPS